MKHPVSLFRSALVLALLAVLLDGAGCRAHVQPRSAGVVYATGGVCDPCGAVQ
jgi:hypothetical protein